MVVLWLKKHRVNILFGLSLLLLTIFGLFFFFDALNHITGFSGFALNGAFQLMNPLRRLEAGWVIGRDFQFFHGPLVPLLHFPLYKLFGGGLFGSEMSRWLVSPSLFFSSGFLFMWAWFNVRAKRRDYKKPVIGLAFLTVLTYLTAEVITPSNSLLGVRTTFPILVACVLLWREKLPNLKMGPASIPMHAMLISLLLGLSIAAGTEQGIAALLAYLLLSFVSYYRNYDGRFLGKLVWGAKRTGWLLAGVLLGIFAVFTILTLGQPVEALRYAFVTVPGEQFWYFGSEPQGFLTYRNLWMILTLRHVLLAVGLTIAALGLTAWAFRRRLMVSSQKLCLVFLLAYGLLTNVSMLGNYTQAVPLARASTLVLAILLMIIWWDIPKRHAKPSPLGIIRGVAILIIVCLTAFLATMLVRNIRVLDIRRLGRAAWDNYRGNHVTLLGNNWTANVSAFDDNISGKKLWSTYASLYEIDNNQLHPSSEGYDYIIHALGPDSRRRYTGDFKSSAPDFVTTARPSYTVFEEWLWARHWDFYVHLLENYGLVASNEPHFLWQRRPYKPVFAKPAQPLAMGGGTIQLPSATEAGSRVIEVDLRYKTTSLWAELPVFKRLPRYMLRPVQTTSSIGISLPPYESQWRFPIILDPAQPEPYLLVSTDGLLPGATFEITAVEYRPLQLDAQTLGGITEPSLLKK